MPLRDHFRSPLNDRRSWDELHGTWPAVIVMALNRIFPERYVAAPRVHLGPYFEIDVAYFDEDETIANPFHQTVGEGGVATVAWAPPKPTFEVTAGLPDQDEYEVRVYDTSRQRTLVAVVEIVSPSNKDRPESRRTFVAKCVALLQQNVSVTIVDLVTTRQFNLYGDLLELLGQTDASLGSEAPPIYAAACRWRRERDCTRMESWVHALTIRQPLPTLPLWLAENLAVPLELEASYEEACRILRIL